MAEQEDWGHNTEDDLSDEPQNAPPPIQLEICEILKRVFPDSFQDFTVSWKDNCIPKIDNSEMSYGTLCGHIQDLDVEDRAGIIAGLTDFIVGEFIRIRVKSFMMGQHDNEEFLELFSEFLAYFLEVCEEIEGVFSHETAQLQAILGKTVAEFLHFHGTKALYRELTHRLRTACRGTVDKQRRCFRYSSRWSYEAFVNSSSFANVARGIREYVPHEVHYEFMRDFTATGLYHVDAVVASISPDQSEKAFIVTSKQCRDAEMLMLEKFFEPHPGIKKDYGQRINMAFCRVHAEREVVGTYHNYTRALLTPESRFDRTQFHDLITMYILRESGYANDYLRQMQLRIKATFKGILRAFVPGDQVANSPFWSLYQFQMGLIHMGERDRLVRSRLASTEQIRPISRLRVWYFTASSELVNDNIWSELDKSNFAEGQRCAIKYLCSEEDDEEDPSIRLKLVTSFYRFIANREEFMKELFEKVQSEILNNKKIDLTRLMAFRHDPYVRKRFSGRIETLIHDIQRKETHHGEIENEVAQEDPSIEVGSSSVVKERDWQALKDTANLLVYPTDLMPIRDSAQNLLEPLHGSHRELLPKNALATLTIMTQMFTKKDRQFTMIKMLLYQFQVLRLFQTRNHVPMQEIFDTLIRPEIDENQRMQAEDVVYRLVMSLVEPYCMLLTCYDPFRPDRSTRVHKNSDFWFEEAEVSLVAQNLVKQSTDYSP